MVALQTANLVSINQGDDMAFKDATEYYEWRAKYRADNLSEMRKQELSRQNKRRAKIARAIMYYKMTACYGADNVPDDAIKDFPESVLQAAKECVNKWLNS